MSIALLLGLAPEIFKTIDKAILNKDEAAKLKAEITSQMINADSELMKTSASIIVAEAQGESWLQRSWRPIMMIWFAILIGAYWFGFTPVSMPDEAINSLFTLVQLGIGGYVVGRSVEKTAALIVPAINRK